VTGLTDIFRQHMSDLGAHVGGRGVPVLTIRQPWAGAVAAGYKDVENRSWSTSYRGPLLIHAAGRVDPGWVDSPMADTLAGIDDEHTGVHSAIIGQAILADVVRDSDSPWAIPDLYHWVLDQAMPFLVPIPARGRLGLWFVGREL
jgi:ASCH domain